MSKTILVTGATAGFGLASTRLFLSQGWNVIGTGRRAERLDALHQEFGNAFTPIALDMRDRDAVTVRGLDGCSFCDARKTHTADAVWTGDLVFNADYNHVFSTRKNEFAILDPGLRRAIAIASRGNVKLVCWNPGPDGLPDRNLGADDWRKFVCVEPATLFRENATVKIAPGESHELLMAIQAVPEK